MRGKMFFGFEGSNSHNFISILFFVGKRLIVESLLSDNSWYYDLVYTIIDKLELYSLKMTQGTIVFTKAVRLLIFLLLRE